MVDTAAVYTCAHTLVVRVKRGFACSRRMKSNKNEARSKGEAAKRKKHDVRNVFSSDQSVQYSQLLSQESVDFLCEIDAPTDGNF